MRRKSPRGTGSKQTTLPRSTRSGSIQKSRMPYSGLRTRQAQRRGRRRNPVRRLLCFVKIESTPFAEHIADSHGLNFEIKRSPDAAFVSFKRGRNAWERLSGSSSPELSESIVSGNRPLLGSPVVTMMQTTESGKRHDLGVTSWLRAWSAMGRVSFQFQMRSLEGRGGSSERIQAATVLDGAR